MKEWLRTNGANSIAEVAKYLSNVYCQEQKITDSVGRSRYHYRSPTYLLVSIWKRKNIRLGYGKKYWNMALDEMIEELGKEKLYSKLIAFF